MAKTKKRMSFYKILGRITDILIYPVIVLAVFSSFVMLNAKRENQVYSVFGVSIVKILSGSMTASGFNKGDMIVLFAENTDNLRVGDDIAFYRYRDPDDPSINQLKKIHDFDNLPEISTESVIGTKTKKDAAQAKSPVIFHQIIGVYQAKDGTRFFQTQGTSNNTADGTLIREDFVVGKHNGTPQWLRDTFEFCSSPKGMIILVILPLSILIFFQLLEIFEIINAILIEKKVLSLDIRYDHADSYKNNIGTEMRFADQVYFYDVVPVQDKNPIKDFLWEDVLNSDKKKNIKKASIINKAISLYPDSPEDYWNYIVNNQKTNRLKKQLVKRHNLARVVKIGQEKNKSIENYEKLKYTEDFIKAAEELSKKQNKQKKNNKQENKKSVEINDKSTNEKINTDKNLKENKDTSVNEKTKNDKIKSTKDNKSKVETKKQNELNTEIEKSDNTSKSSTNKKINKKTKKN